MGHYVLSAANTCYICSPSSYTRNGHPTVDVFVEQHALVTTRKRSLEKDIVFTLVCDSVHKEGCLLHCMLGYTSPGQTPPIGRHPPGPDTPPADTLSHSDTMEYGQRTGGTHPTGMHTFLHVTVHKQSCRRVMFTQACVKNSVNRKGCLPADTPLDRLGRHPLGRHLPPGQTRQTCPLTGRHPPWTD